MFDSYIDLEQEDSMVFESDKARIQHALRV